VVCSFWTDHRKYFPGPATSSGLCDVAQYACIGRACLVITFFGFVLLRTEQCCWGAHVRVMGARGHAGAAGACGEHQPHLLVRGVCQGTECRSMPMAICTRVSDGETRGWFGDAKTFRLQAWLMPHRFLLWPGPFVDRSCSFGLGLSGCCMLKACVDDLAMVAPSCAYAKAP